MTTDVTEPQPAELAPGDHTHDAPPADPHEVLAAASSSAVTVTVLDVASDCSASDECSICYEGFDDPRVKYTTLPCSHRFCKRCIERLRDEVVEPSCPLCRAPLPDVR